MSATPITSRTESYSCILIRDIQHEAHMFYIIRAFFFMQLLACTYIILYHPIMYILDVFPGERVISSAGLCPVDFRHFLQLLPPPSRYSEKGPASGLPADEEKHSHIVEVTSEYIRLAAEPCFTSALSSS